MLDVLDLLSRLALAAGLLLGLGLGAVGAVVAVAHARWWWWRRQQVRDMR